MSGSMFPIGTTVVNITTSDLNENNATCQFTVTILDNEAPILNCPNISSTTDAGFNFSSSVMLNSTAADNVDANVSANCIPSSFNNFLVGDTIVNCTSTDTAGNTGSCSLVVTVKDDEAPILNCPNITSTTDTGFNFSSTVMLNSTAIDNVDADVSVDCIPSSFNNFLVGDTNVHCTSTDTAGNTGSCSLIVTVLDDEAPMLNCLNITSTTDTGFNFSSSVILNSTATDNVDTNVSAYCIPSSEDDFVVGDTIVNCTSTDTAGNIGSCILIVTVIDDEAPMLNCPNITSTTDTGFNFSSSVILNSTATDNVGTDVSAYCIPSSEDDFVVGDTIVNCTSTDTAGNTGSCSLIVTVLDDEAPMLNCPNITSTTDTGFNFSSSVILNSTATDNVDTVVSAYCIPSSEDEFVVGDTIVNCTSTDTAGNTGSCSLIVTVLDDEAPMLNCPNITSTTDTGFNFSSSVILNSTATDNVDTDVSAYCIPSSEDDFVVGDTIVNCTSSDTAGNTGSCSLIVTVLDDEAPMLNCPNITSTTDTGFNFSSSVMLNSTATDNVDTDVSANCIPSSEDDFVVGDTIVNCTSTDTAGNTGSCSLVVTVKDDEAPMLNCPNITSTTDTGFNFSSSVILNSTATDNVDTDVSAYCIPSSEEDFVVGDTIVNCTSSDTAGNTGSCSLIVTVLDDEAPMLNCPNITSTTDTGFNFSSSVMLNSTATDHVDTDVSANCIPSSEDDFVVGDTIVNCTSTDTAGNTGSCSLVVTVKDDEAPVLNCPNITSTTDTGFNFSSSVILNSTATDNVDTDVSAYCIPSSEDDFVVGDTIVNCTSTDTAGNIGSCILIVTVIDDEAPILNCPNITSTTDTGFNFSSSVILNSTAIDNVDTDVSANCIPSSEDDFVVGDTIVNCTSTDAAGNTGSCSLIVTVKDDEAPILNCPNITSTTDTGFNFSSTVMLNSTAIDNVDADVSVDCIPSFNNFLVGNTNVNCTSTDTAGNTGSCSLIVTVLDDEAPMLSCPNITSTTDTGFNFSSSVILNSTATDNVDTDVSAYCIPSSEDDFVVGDTIVNCTSTDTAGNIGSCILIVTVIDDEAPILNCPNITSTTDTGFNFSSSVILNSTATDNVDTDVSANCIPSSEDDFVVGDTIVNCTSTDAAGNTGSCSLIVTVKDDEAPILNCPNITSTTDTGFNFSSTVMLNSTAIDNVDADVSVDCIPSFNNFLVGNTNVNCTSTDTAGNTGSCSLIVTVLDDEAPMLSCPNITSTTDTGFNFSSSVILNSTATDNVDTDVSAYCIPSSEDDFVVGDTIVNCTSTDTAGNIGSCILIVTVIDDEAPILNCPNITSTTDTGFNFSSSVILNSTATDNVDTDVSANCIPSSEDDFVVGDTIVNCTSTDAAGNTGSCSLIVTVKDDEAPILNCPNISSTTDTGFNFSSTVMLNSTAIDNVDADVSVDCIPSPFNNFLVGNTNVNCTSTDTAGNTGSCSLIVTVLDDEAPMLNCPNITSTTDTGFNFSSSVILNSTATDNVDTDVSAYCIPSSEDDFVVGDTIVNCTSTDTAGNIGSCILIVTVIDDEAPILNCPNITSTTDTGFNFSSSVILNSTATDNVDTDVYADCIPSSEDDFVVGDTIVNCTSTDAAGNTGSCSLIVTVLDDEAPVLNCPNVTSTTDTGFNFSSSVILNSTATDNVDTEVSADCIPSSEDDFVVGDTVVNCTSTDTAGNTGSCILIVTVIDDEAPILYCPNITSTTDTGFNFSSSVILNSTATDNVDTDVYADCIPSSEDDFVVGDTVINCSSTDTAGNTGSCSLIVTVIDDEAPMLNCPNITSTTDTGFNFSSSVILNSTSNDNVDTDVSAYCIPSSEDDFVVGDTIVNCTSTDAAGNTGFCSLVVTVIDDEAPILDCQNITSTTDTGFNFSSSVILNSTATDNVDTDVYADCIPSSEDDFVVGDTIINCTSTDAAGNTGFCSLAVTVIDDEAPILNCQNITSTTDTGFNFSSSVILNSTATDNVDTDVYADCIPSSEDDFVVGDTIVNCTSTDTAGNTGSCSLIVTVIDDEAPILNCPNATSTTDTGFNFSSSVMLNSTATDNIDTDVSVYCIPLSEDDFVLGKTIVNCTSTDTSGNTGSCSLVVTVIDDEAPILNCPNITSTTDTGFNFSSTVMLNSTAIDNVDTDVSVDCISSSEDNFVVGDTIVNCTSTDTAGNNGSCSLVVTVKDDEAPVLKCSNITSTTDNGFSFSSSVMLNSTATDNADPYVSVDCIPSSFDNFLVGDTVVNCTSTDSAGNTGFCSLIVTVIDDEPPVLNCPNISSISDVGFNYSSSVMLNSNATDNVDTDVYVDCIPSSEDDFVVGDTIVNCFSTDTAGNTGSCSLIVTVIDHLFCPENMSTIVDPFSETATVVLPSIGVGVVTSPRNGSVFMQGSTPVFVTREEEQCIFYVYVEPLIQPTCDDIFQLSSRSTVVVIWFVEEPTQYSLEIVVGNETASYVPMFNIAFIEVSVPSVLTGVVSITDHPDNNCSFTLSVFPYTCNVTSYPSEYLTALSATNQEFDIPPEEQCFNESMITVNTTCIFGCDVGYNLIGNESVSCLEDGLSDTLPTCELVTCQLPSMLPSFLQTTSTVNNCTKGEQIVYSTSCSYDCEVGYNLTGNSTVTCLENGELSSELPKCGIVQCFVPSFSERLISFENTTCYERMYINFTDSCYFECDVGYNLIGNGTVTCEKDALLSSELPTCQVVSCSIPVLPPRLSTMTSQCNGRQSINYTDTCSYSCDEGYNLIGSESVTCLANTSLSDFLPTCEVVSCSIPVLPPRLSTMTSQCNEGQSINYTDTCSYSCDVGYNLIGSESVTCLANKSLSDFLPICEVVTCSVPLLSTPLSTSCPMGQEVNYNTSCEFSCSPGFDIIGSTSLDCLANGTLSGDIPMCEIVVCPVPEVFHPELSSIFRNCSEGSSIEFNTTCVFECSEGYDLIGSESVKCQSNGTLSESLPTCNVVSCSIPVLPSHLSAMTSQCDGGQSINYTDICLYSCDVGYNLTGSESVTCLANTSLSDFLPTCEVVTCSVPQLLPPLSTSCPMGQEVNYNTSCEFSCSPGFDIIGSTSLDCLANGTLSGDIPMCEIVVCPLPEVFHPELSSIFRNCSEGSSIDFDTTCVFECSEGYDLIGNQSVSCQSNGTLSESLPTCNVISCSIPVLPLRLSTMTLQCNGGQSINYTDTCSYSCDIGYNLIGSESVTCLANTSLSDILPTCEVVVCQLPEVFHPELSSVFGNCSEGSSIDFDTTCSFECSEGYDLMGSENVGCLSNGTLSESLPTCNVVSCSIPVLPPRLSTMMSQCNGGQSINYTDICLYSCDVGYNLIGSDSVTCLANTSLSDFLPTCEVVTCQLPTMFPSFLQTTSTVNNCTEGEQILYNTSCSYDCEVGYNLTGNSTVSCLENGDLSSELPKCGVLQCYVPSFSDGLISLESTCYERMYINYTDSCYFECEVGFDLIGNDTVTCGEDALLSSDLPACQVVMCPLPEVFHPELSSKFRNCSGGSSIEFDTTCTFECSEGYDLIGSESVRCQSNGTLTESPPTCNVVSCSIPELPSHSSTMTSQCNGGQSINYTQTCSFSCDTGYNLVGSSSVTCLANSSLSDSLPTCEIVTCSIPMFPANLTTPNTTQCGEEMVIDYNTLCMYECQPGYDLIGNTSIGCQANGELSADLPTCQVIDICQRFSPCPTVSTCNGGINTFSCSCNAGYTTDVTITSDTTTYTCMNIIECNLSPPVCDSNAQCDDLSGSFLCTCMEGFSGNGTFCEALEPCSLSPCQNGGTCTNTDDGSSYVCTCPQSFTDVNCNTVIVEQEPLAVVTNPVSQMVDFEDRVTFSCSFQNAQSFRWFKDSAPIPNSENQSPLVINPALAEDQGYYYCSAVGEDDTTATTDQALLTVNGVDNYVVMATFLTKTFNNSLLDRTSSYFIQLSNELINFITTPLQNNFDSSVAVSVNTLSSGSVVSEFGVYIYNGSVPDSEQLSIIRSTMTNLAEENPTFLDPSSIQTFSAVTCPAGSYITSYGYEAMFDTGDIGSRANSTDTNCPDYTINRDYRIEAICVGDTVRPCVWVPQMNCGRNLTADELLKILLQEEVTEDNAEMVVEEVAEITTMTETISTEGLEIVADFLEDIVELDTRDVEVTESFVAIANNYADVAEETRDMAEDETGASSRVVVSLETQLAVVEVQNDSLRIIEANIAAEVLDVTADEISQGLTVYMSATPDGDSISGDDFQVEEGDLSTQPEVLQAQATLLLPAILADKLTGSTGRLVITIHLDTALFRDRELTELNENQTEFGRELNSRIIGAAVDNEEIEDLEQPVVLSFTPINPNGTNATCVSYNFTEKRWSTRGCRKTSNESTDRITCECDHLTNFGILMDIYGGEGLSAQADFILEIISYVGCCMSIWGLVITILTYASNKKLRDRKPNQILLSLSASLLCLYIVFLVMISLDTERGVEEIPPLPCCILAGFLHYFTLTSLFWMAVEGYNMYILFVRVLNTYLPRFLRKASLFAWGTPMLIVGITGGASRQYYAQTDFCFLQFWPLIGGLLIPVGLIMIFNFVIFVRVILRLNKTIKGKQLDKTEKRQRLRRFQNAVCILILMGLTWAVGYLSIIQPAAEVVQGVFTILNSLQGYFIFMLYCVRQPQVRRAWRSQFSCCLPKSFGASSAFTSTSGQTNSTFKNSSARLIAQRGQQNRLLANSESNGFRPETMMRTPPERLPRAAAYDNEGGDW
ncbi:uncharacterized protein LOC121423655 isoform X2 [Lytechinus variegatus]|uniref:uncharacterized protein LOC121423655 isoform X2 n=1 Tax=Lytechinus variegatus TaxID=7654 RepID=UPI001BB0FA8B|nr:uncharacterized protein LOC121423655 isoform X2 [Lytechinus variegatus]